MKGFMMKDGDVVIENGVIRMVEGNALLRQTVENVLRTNKGEWEFDKNEGIDFHTILKKRINHDEVREQILQGLQQVDETFTIEEYSWNIDGRNLNISFKAVNDSGEEVSQTLSY